MNFEEKINELERVLKEKGDVPADTFAMKGLVALALVMTKEDDQKYLEFINTLESMLSIEE